MSFPDPPSYAKFYTAEAVKSGTAPPPPPVPTKFNLFGEECDLEAPYIPDLPELGLKQVYIKCNTMEEYKNELKKLSSSIMVAFLDLISILTKDPLSPERHEQFETLKTLFINMHHVINECRVVQARATLATIQKEQNRQLEIIIETFNNAKTGAIKYVKEAADIGERFCEEKEDVLAMGDEFQVIETNQNEMDPMIALLFGEDDSRVPRMTLHSMPEYGDSKEEISKYMNKRNAKKKKPKDKTVRLEKEKDSSYKEKWEDDEAELYSKIKDSLKSSNGQALMEDDESTVA
uniref:Mediator of RNA polymerase II transcription subunit 7 n=1 Tax=Panagrolaimus sp. ES5 TaxID=591445 RepID=A0AC34GUC6_9BILA